MQSREIATVTIPKDFQGKFDGLPSKEMEVFDIKESPEAGGEIGTIKIMEGILSGWTFAVRKNDRECQGIRDRWRIVR